MIPKEHLFTGRDSITLSTPDDDLRMKAYRLLRDAGFKSDKYWNFLRVPKRKQESLTIYPDKVLTFYDGDSRHLPSMIELTHENLQEIVDKLIAVFNWRSPCQNR